MLTCGSSLTAKLLDWLQNLADRPRFSPQQRLIPRIEASPQITLMGFIKTGAAVLWSKPDVPEFSRLATSDLRA
jgi:hypothetical protein